MLSLFDPYSPADKAAQRLAARLALKGHQITGSYAPSVNAHWVPYCDTPVTVFRTVRPGRQRRSLEVSFPAPCRNCPKCLLFRRMKWRQRIINEILTCDDAARRSWFMTLTFAPVHMAGVIAEAQPAIRAGVPRQEAVEAAAYTHVQRYFKRVRKNLRAAVRYIAVPEYGEEKGRLHYHLILHEQDKPLLKAALQAQWRSFTHCKLIDCGGSRGVAGAASYVSKYIAKGAGRPRASTKYGRGLPVSVAARPSF